MNPFARNLLWVFRVGDCGGAAAAVATAKRLGAGLIVKYHDANPADDQKYGFQEQFRACLKLGQQRGIPVLAWGYCYGDNYGSLLKEADAAIMALHEGAAGYVIDAETEWEVPQGNDWAKRFLDRVYVQVADASERLAYAPFWKCADIASIRRRGSAKAVRRSCPRSTRHRQKAAGSSSRHVGNHQNRL